MRQVPLCLIRQVLEHQQHFRAANSRKVLRRLRRTNALRTVPCKAALAAKRSDPATAPRCKSHPPKAHPSLLFLGGVRPPFPLPVVHPLRPGMARWIRYREVEAVRGLVFEVCAAYLHGVVVLNSGGASLRRVRGLFTGPAVPAE